MRTVIAAVILPVIAIAAALAGAQVPPPAGKQANPAAPPQAPAPAPSTATPAPGSPAGAQSGSTAGPTPAPPHAYLYIGWPNDGQVLPAGRPVRVWFGLRNMGVAPKGIPFPHTGHHHLLIDAEPPAPGEEIPSDRNHLHFGAGETETLVELPPGKHTLQLVMGDAHHRSFDPPVVSKRITVTVR